MATVPRAEDVTQEHPERAARIVGRKIHPALLDREVLGLAVEHLARAQGAFCEDVADPPPVHDRLDEIEHLLVGRPCIVHEAAFDALAVEAEDPAGRDRVEAVLVAQLVGVHHDVRVVVHHLRPERPRRLVFRAAAGVAVAGGVRPGAADRTVEARRVAREDVQEFREVQLFADLPFHLLPVVGRPEVRLIHLRRDLHRPLLVEVCAAFLVLRERLLVEDLDRLAAEAGEIHRAEHGNRLETLRPEDRAEATAGRHPFLERDAREPHEVLACLTDAECPARVLQLLARLLRVQSPQRGRVLQFRFPIPDLDPHRRVGFADHADDVESRLP